MTGLLDEMRNHDLREIPIPVTHKDTENGWYKTISKIERDVQSHEGLTVRYIQERIRAGSATPALKSQANPTYGFHPRNSKIMTPGARTTSR